MSKNKFKLTLPKLPSKDVSPGIATPPFRTPNSTDRSNLFNKSRGSIDLITQALEGLNADAIAMNRIKIFMRQKERMGEIREEDLEKLGELGHGNGDTVMKVRHIPTQLIMARKLIHLELHMAVKKQIIRELMAWHDFNSPYIVGFYHAFQTDGEISICMEYMDCGSLDLILKRAGRIPEPILAKIALAVLKGLGYLRDKHNIMHGDIKPSNILVNSYGEIKICDFGVSGQLINSVTNSFVGNRSYMSPERLEGSHYSVLSDIWSLALSLIEMAIGIYPIPSPDPKFIDKILSECSKHQPIEAKKIMPIFDILECIVNRPPPRLEHKYFHPEFTDFLDKCLKKCPDERADLKESMDHPWIKMYEYEPIDIAGWLCSKMNFSPIDVQYSYQYILNH